MDSVTERPDIGYLNDYPVLIVASSEAASARARRSIEAAGLRIGHAMGLGQACERIQLQAAASVRRPIADPL